MADNGLVLIDSSAWILALRPGLSAKARESVGEIVEHDLGATAGIIMAELLQGCRTQQELHELKQDLEALHYLPLGERGWARVAEMGFELRRQGRTVPLTDLVVSQIAMENSCRLLHADRHFITIAGRFPLRQVAVGRA